MLRVAIGSHLSRKDFQVKVNTAVVQTLDVHGMGSILFSSPPASLLVPGGLPRSNTSVNGASSVRGTVDAAAQWDSSSRQGASDTLKIPGSAERVRLRRTMFELPSLEVCGVKGGVQGSTAHALHLPGCSSTPAAAAATQQAPTAAVKGIQGFPSSHRGEGALFSPSKQREAVAFVVTQVESATAITVVTVVRSIAKSVETVTN